MSDDKLFSRYSNEYPFVEPFTLTHNLLPGNKHGDDIIGSPYGVFIRPFISINEDAWDNDFDIALSTIGGVLARCSTCHAYINAYCDITSLRWFCSICGSRNMLSKSNHAKIKSIGERNRSIQDVRIPFREGDGAPAGLEGKKEVESIKRPLVHVFIIEEDLEFDALRTVVDGISEAVILMHPDIHVALLTISKRIGIYRFNSDDSTVQYVHYTVPSNGNEALYEVSVIDMDSQPVLTMPLTSVVDFTCVSSPIGTCRKALLAALNQLLDDATDRLEPFDFMSPNLLRASIESIGSWILDDAESQRCPEEVKETSYLHDDIGDFLRESSTNAFPRTSSFKAFPGVQDIIGKFSNILLGSVDDKSAYSPNANQSNGAIQECSGVICHLILVSGTKAKNYDYKGKYDWIEPLSEKFGERSLAVNLWTIINFDDKKLSCNLHDISPLSAATGGKIYRFVLGSNVNEVRLAFTETMIRELTQPRATKCLMRIRSSSSLKVVSDSFIAGLVRDRDYDDISRIGSCLPDSSYCFQFYRNPNYVATGEVSGQTFAMIQIAFAYDCMMETDDDIEQDEYQKDSGRTYSTKALAAMMKAEIISKSTNDRRNPLKHYNNQRNQKWKKLVAVRRMRVITIPVDCTTKTFQSLRSIQPSNIVLAIARQHLQNNLQLCKGHVLDWIKTLVASATVIVRESQSPNAHMTDQDVVSNILQLHPIKEIIQLVYGLINTIDCWIENNNSCDHDPDRNCDSTVQVILTLQSLEPIHAKNFFYPHLYPLYPFDTQQISKNSSDNQLKSVSVESSDESKWCLLLREAIPLRREAMIVSSSSDFLLNNGSDLIIYRSKPVFPQSTIVSSKHSADIDPKSPSLPLPFRNTIDIHRSMPLSPPKAESAPPGTLSDLTTSQANAQDSLDNPQETLQFPTELQRLRTWVINAIHQQVDLSPVVPMINTASAGQSSAENFTKNLIEDYPCTSLTPTFANFLKLISDDVINKYFAET